SRSQSRTSLWSNVMVVCPFFVYTRQVSNRDAGMYSRRCSRGRQRVAENPAATQNAARVAANNSAAGILRTKRQAWEREWLKEHHGGRAFDRCSAPSTFRTTRGPRCDTPNRWRFAAAER